MSFWFQAGNWVVLPFWALAILAPGWRWTARVLGSPWIAAPAALLYAGLLLPQLPAVLPLLLNPAGPQLSDIAAGLGTPAGATVAWIHLLAFDLFTGRWIYLDARSRGVAWWLSSPALALTFLFGPFGLLTYLGLRSLASTRSIAM
jgi:hypothetical protein